MKYLVYLGMLSFVIGINHSCIEVVKSILGNGVVSVITSTILAFAIGFYVGLLTVIIEDKIKN